MSELLRRKVIGLLGGSLQSDILADALIALIQKETGRLGGRPRVYPDVAHEPVAVHEPVSEQPKPQNGVAHKPVSEQKPVSERAQEPVSERVGGKGGVSGLTSDPDLTPDLSKQIREKSVCDERPTLPAGFIEDFWALYPRHRRVARARAVRAWVKQKPPRAEVRAALAWQVRLPDWTKDGGTFVPYPEKYLNARRWEDERPGPRPQLPGIPAYKVEPWEPSEKWPEKREELTNGWKREQGAPGGQSGKGR